MKVKSIRLLTVAACGLAGFAMATPAIAKDPDQGAGGKIDFYSTVSAIREVPAGNPMPGLHLDMKIDGRVTDVYVAPMDFIVKYKVKISKGDDVHVVGTRIQSEDSDLVLAYVISTGTFAKGGVFRETLTTYLRNDGGPFWDEPKPKPVD